MPKVSVIIPAYNAQKYLAETIDSVMAQTFSDFELIVVDDGSKDKTVSIIRQYQAKYPEKIRLIQKENGGPASARNAGIRVANGEYIAFNDADDLWLPEKLEKQVAYFDAQLPEVGLVYTDARKFDHDGLWTLPKRFNHKFVEGMIYKDLLKDNMVPNQSVLVRKKCFEDVGLFDESPEVFTSEDYDMWLRIALKYEINYLDEILSLYREHIQGINKNFERSHNAAIRVMEKHLEMAQNNHELEDAIRDALSKYLYIFGYCLLRNGKGVVAKEILIRSSSIRFNLKTLLMILATFVPFKALDILNRLIKTFLKPPKIIKTKGKDETKELVKRGLTNE